MQANWSLILNMLLLIGVIVAIIRVFKMRRQATNIPFMSSPPQVEDNKYFDDIIAVRKVTPDLIEDNMPSAKLVSIKPSLEQVSKPQASDNNSKTKIANQTLMLFLQAQDNRTLMGYDLLQTVLAAGLRFGEGHLFHRHQHANGQGPVLFSLAAATVSGVFDLQNIGAFSVKGLCLFMRTSGNAVIDKERFGILLDTAKQLSEELDTRLLNDQKHPLTEESIASYYSLLSWTNNDESE